MNKTLICFYCLLTFKRFSRHQQSLQHRCKLCVKTEDAFSKESKCFWRYYVTRSRYQSQAINENLHFWSIDNIWLLFQFKFYFGTVYFCRMSWHETIWLNYRYVLFGFDINLIFPKSFICWFRIFLFSS